MSEENKKGRFSRANKPRLDPNQIIDREMGGMTRDLKMSDLDMPEVEKIQNMTYRLPAGMSDKQEDLDDAMRSIMSTMHVTVTRLPNDDRHRETYEIKTLGKNEKAYESTMTFVLDRRCQGSMWLVRNFRAMANT